MQAIFAGSASCKGRFPAVVAVVVADAASVGGLAKTATHAASASVPFAEPSDYGDAPDIQVLLASEADWGENETCGPSALRHRAESTACIGQTLFKRIWSCIVSTYIDPHIHMISRVTDDYQRMAYAGCVAVTEPAFWAGFDRGTVDGFRDYFRHLTEVEPKRAAQFNIRHYSWLCINAKEAENVELSRGVIAVIPEFLNKPNVLGIGEIGLNKNTRNEAIVFQEHVDLAMKYNELILIHTPHLEDKYKGTRMIIDMLKQDRRVTPERVLIDHVEEHTVRHALDNGFWCAMTLYPTTKCTPQRAVDIIEMVGTDRIMANSAGDWGKSDPLAVPEFIQEMKRRGHAESAIRKVTYENPLAFFRQCARWQDWPVEDTTEKTKRKPAKAHA